MNSIARNLSSTILRVGSDLFGDTRLKELRTGKIPEGGDGFIASAGKMKRFGVIGLIVVAMMLLNTVFKEMNIIFLPSSFIQRSHIALSPPVINPDCSISYDQKIERSEFCMVSSNKSDT